MNFLGDLFHLSEQLLADSITCHTYVTVIWLSIHVSLRQQLTSDRITFPPDNHGKLHWHASVLGTLPINIIEIQQVSLPTFASDKFHLEQRFPTRLASSWIAGIFSGILISKLGVVLDLREIQLTFIALKLFQSNQLIYWLEMSKTSMHFLLSFSREILAKKIFSIIQSFCSTTYEKRCFQFIAFHKFNMSFLYSSSFAHSLRIPRKNFCNMI